MSTVDPSKTAEIFQYQQFNVQCLFVGVPESRTICFVRQNADIICSFVCFHHIDIENTIKGEKKNQTGGRESVFRDIFQNDKMIHFDFFCYSGQRTNVIPLGGKCV